MMVTDYFTAQDVARVLDISEESARELLESTIRWHEDELQELAEAAGVKVEQLIK